MVEVLLHNTVSEIVLRNCAHVIGSGANVEDVFDNDAAELDVESLIGEDNQGKHFRVYNSVVSN